MTTMKENKGKGLANEESVQAGEDVHTQSHPAASEKRKTLSKTLDTGSLPSRRGNKKPRHGSSKPAIVETSPSVLLAVAKQSSAVKTPPDANPSNSPFIGPPNSGPMTLLRNEGLAWDRFKQAVTDKDIAIYYDIFVKEFE